MTQPNTSSDLAIVKNPPPLPAVSTHQQSVTIRRRTIFDLNEEELQRLKFMAQMYAASSFNSGSSKQREGDFFLIMLKGMELGITPMAAVDTINIIKGKPTLDAKGMLALVKASGQLENINIDSTPERCMVSVKRCGNDEQIVSFTIQDAEKMSLQGKDNYKSQPEIMLKWRAITKAMREVFPDIISGLYTQEELAPDITIVSDDGSMKLLESPGPKPNGQNNHHSSEDSSVGSADSNKESANKDRGLSDESIETVIKWAKEKKGYAGNETALLKLLNKSDWKFTGNSWEKAMESINNAHVKFVNSIVNWAKSKQYGDSEADLLGLLEEENWMFTQCDFQTAQEAIETAHNALLEEVKRQRRKKSGNNVDDAVTNAAPDDEPQDAAPETLSESDRSELDEWVFMHFNIPLSAVSEKLNDDMSRFTTLDTAQAFIRQTALKELWPAVAESAKYVAQSKYILFETEAGHMRFYSREKFAEFVGQEYAASNHITEMPDGELIDIEPLLLTGERKKQSYIVVVEAKPLLS